MSSRRGNSIRIGMPRHEIGLEFKSLEMRYSYHAAGMWLSRVSRRASQTDIRFPI